MGEMKGPVLIARARYRSQRLADSGVPIPQDARQEPAAVEDGSRTMAGKHPPSIGIENPAFLPPLASPHHVGGCVNAAIVVLEDRTRDFVSEAPGDRRRYGVSPLIPFHVFVRYRKLVDDEIETEAIIDRAGPAGLAGTPFRRLLRGVFMVRARFRLHQLLAFTNISHDIKYAYRRH